MTTNDGNRRSGDAIGSSGESAKGPPLKPRSRGWLRILVYGLIVIVVVALTVGSFLGAVELSIDREVAQLDDQGFEIILFLLAVSILVGVVSYGLLPSWFHRDDVHEKVGQCSNERHLMASVAAIGLGVSLTWCFVDDAFFGWPNVKVGPDVYTEWYHNWYWLEHTPDPDGFSAESKLIHGYEARKNWVEEYYCRVRDVAVEQILRGEDLEIPEWSASRIEWLRFAYIVRVNEAKAGYDRKRIQSEQLGIPLIEDGQEDLSRLHREWAWIAKDFKEYGFSDDELTLPPEVRKILQDDGK